MERTEKRVASERNTEGPAEVQLAHIVRPPLEQEGITYWRSCAEIQIQILVKAWLKKLKLASLEGETVIFRAPANLTGEWVETLLKHKQEAA